jgi:hypothetical protein
MDRRGLREGKKIQDQNQGLEKAQDPKEGRVFKEESEDLDAVAEPSDHGEF